MGGRKVSCLCLYLLLEHVRKASRDKGSSAQNLTLAFRRAPISPSPSVSTRISVSLFSACPVNGAC
ncbi:unnamed protein product [Ixodes persulcatus]